jgi:DivIVA domain-containing protein
MYQNRLNLTPQDILEKDFKIDTRGYRLKEVDQFLDEIITDYEEFFKIISEQEKEKEELLEQIMSLKQEIRNLKMSIEIAKSGAEDDQQLNTTTNLDVMRRLAQLEKIVYGKEE